MLEAAPAAGGAGAVDVLMIDNYDSFTYNLVQYLEELGAAVTVVRNDALSADAVVALRPRRVVISPGPGAPRDAGVCLEVVRRLAGRVPILGVCLGLQCIYEAFGGDVTHAGEVVHGKASAMRHDGRGIFLGLPSPLRAVRYHSLAGTWASLPGCLEVSCTSGGEVARTGAGASAPAPASAGAGAGESRNRGDVEGRGLSGAGGGSDGEVSVGPLPGPLARASGPPVIIQGARHRTFVVEGVQFHPESVLTEHGHAMLRNFLTWDSGLR